jgi:plastocyanin
MKMWIAVLLGCLALGLVVAGCGDDDDDGGSADTPQQPAGEGEGGVQEEGDTDTGGGTQVSLRDIKFNPADVSVKAGDTITFINDESVPHDVHKTGGPGPDFSSGDVGGMQEGDTYKLTLDKPGKYEYVCEVHAPGMAGTITVK